LIRWRKYGKLILLLVLSDLPAAYWGRRALPYLQEFGVYEIMVVEKQGLLRLLFFDNLRIGDQCRRRPEGSDLDDDASDAREKAALVRAHARAWPLEIDDGPFRDGAIRSAADGRMTEAIVPVRLVGLRDVRLVVSVGHKQKKLTTDSHG
jgi:hypothetical protein